MNSTLLPSGKRYAHPFQSHSLKSNTNHETQQIEKKAYPADAPKEKKQKTKKDKGSKYPGAAKAEEQAEQGKEPSQATASDVGKSASEAMDKLSVQ